MPSPKAASVSIGEFRAGWPVLAASFLGLLVSIGPLMIYPFGVFVIPLSEEFGWSRGAIAGALMVGNVSLALSGPLHGIIIDRFGVRGPVIASCCGLAVSFGSLFWLTPSILHFYACFALVAFLGASASPLGYSRVIIDRFDFKRGFALGLALGAVGTSAFLLPPLVQHLIELGGWRYGYLLLGGLALLPIPVIAAVFRFRSQADEVPLAGEAQDVSSRVERDKRFVLLLLALIFFVFGAVSVGVVVHLVPLLRDSGVAAGTAATIAMVVGITLIVSRAGIGWVIDRVHAPLVLACIAVLLTLSCIVLATSQSIALVIIAALLLGLGLGAEVDLMSYLVSRYWPRQSFGRIYGILYGAFSIGNGLGPWAMGIAFDRNEDYVLALTVAAVGSILVVAAGSLLPRYSIQRG